MADPDRPRASWHGGLVALLRRLGRRSQWPGVNASRVEEMRVEQLTVVSASPGGIEIQRQIGIQRSDHNLVAPCSKTTHLRSRCGKHTTCSARDGDNLEGCGWRAAQL